MDLPRQARRPAFLRSLPLAGALVLGSLAPQSAAGESAPLARRIPADTLLHVSIPDLSASIGELKDLPLGRIAAEEEVKDFLSTPLARVRRQWTEWSEEAMQREGIDLDRLLSTPWRAADFAVTRLRLGERGVEFGLAARLDAGEGWPGVREVLGRLAALSRRSPQEAQVEERTVGDRVWTLLRPPADEAVEGAFFWAEDGSDVHLALGSAGSGAAAELFSRVAEGKSGPSLAEDPDFGACAKRCGGTPEIACFLRVPPIVDLLRKGVDAGRSQGAPLPPFLTGERLGAALEALGFTGVRAVSIAATVEGDHWRNDLFVLAPSPRRGLFALGAGTADRSLLARVPEEAVSFSTGTLAVAELWDAVLSAVDRLGEGAAGPLRAGVAAFEEANSIQIRRDLLEAVGDRYVSYSLPSPNLFTPGESATLVPLRDPQAFERAAAALAEALAARLPFLEMKTREAEGSTIRSFSVRPGAGLEMPQGLPFNPLALFSPSFAVKGDLLLVSANARGLQRALGRLESTADPTPPSSDGPGGGSEAPKGAEAIEGYRRFAGGVPEGARSIAYSDPRPTVETVYGVLSSVLPLLGAGGDLPVDLTALPTADAITSHLFGSVSYSVSDAEGIHYRSFSSWGAEAVAFAAGAVGGGAAVARARAARAEAEAAAAIARGRAALLAGLEAQDLGPIRFLSDAEAESAKHWGAVANGTYAILRDLFGAEPANLPLLVYAYATNAGYNRFASSFGDDHSAVYGAFVATRDSSQPVVATLESGDWAPLHLAHGVTHLYVRALAGATRIPGVPAWFEEGLATYVERYQDPARRAWSIESLARLGGPGPFAGFAEGFRITAEDAQLSHKRMLQAGLIVAYYLHGADAEEMEAFVAALRSLREGSPEEVARAVGTLVADEARLEQKVRAFATARSR